MSLNDKTEFAYTKDEIKKAIRDEMVASGFMGHGNGRYYTITGIVITALEKYDKVKGLHQQFMHVTKDMCIDMVKGCDGPHNSLFEEMGKFGYYDDNRGWFWDDVILRNMSIEKLLDIYNKCKNSWK